jgi:hypothetical protein
MGRGQRLVARQRRAGRASLLLAYSFGKAQRLLAGVDAASGPSSCTAPSSRSMPPTAPKAWRCRPHAAPGRRADTPRCCSARSWSRRPRCWAAPGRALGDCSDAFASGWMQLRGARRRQGVDRGFVLSDHADWPGLQAAPSPPPAPARDRHPWLRGGDGALAAAAGPAGRQLPHRIRRMRRFADLYQALDASTATGAKVAALVQYFAAAPPPKTRPGRCTSWPAASRARWCHGAAARAGLRAARASTTGCSRCYQAVGDLAETIAHVLPRPDVADDRTTGPGRLGRAAAAAAARPAAGRQARRVRRWTSWTRGPLPAGQAHRRRLPGGREQAAGAACAGPAWRAWTPSRVAQRLMGWTEPAPSAVGGALAAPVIAPPAPRPTPGAASRTLSSWRTRCRRAPQPWARWRLAGGMEVRRHPRPAGAARRPGVDLVARRRAGDRALPRSGGAGAGLPDGTCWTARCWSGRQRAAGAVSTAAAAHRPQDADEEGAGRCAPVRLRGLRPAGRRRHRPARRSRSTKARRAGNNLRGGCCKAGALRLSPIVRAADWADAAALRAIARERASKA